MSTTFHIISSLLFGLSAMWALYVIWTMLRSYHHRMVDALSAPVEA